MKLHKRLVLVLAAALTAGACFAADDPGDPNGGAPKEKEKKTPKQLVSSSVKASETPIPRIWIGLTGSYTPLKLLHANTNGYSDPNSEYNFNAVSAAGQAGGGLTVNARIIRSFWISVGAIYHYTGYTSNQALNVSYDSNEDLFIERSHVRMIDFPVLVRYTGRKWNLSKYTFYELGAVRRDAFDHKTTYSWFNVNGLVGPGPTLGTSYKPVVYGAVAGAGLIAKDDFGIIVSPEVRYTRWMENTYSSGGGVVNPAAPNGNVFGSQRNQLELTVSFGF